MQVNKETSILEIKDLNKKIDGQSVIDHIHFSIQKGDIYGFLGPNGAGKTTTLRMITRLIFPDSGDIIAFDDVMIDLSSRNITKGGTIVNLTMKEFDLLVFLAQSPNQAFRKEQLYDNVWGIHEYGDINTVTIHVQKIREKLGNSIYITTLRGIGYRFDGETL